MDSTQLPDRKLTCTGSGAKGVFPSLGGAVARFSAWSICIQRGSTRHITGRCETSHQYDYGLPSAAALAHLARINRKYAQQHETPTCLRSAFAALVSCSASSSAASCLSWLMDFAASFCCLRAFSSASACGDATGCRLEALI